MGIGQINALGQLVRTSILSSSATGAPVPLTAGLKTVALTVGANWYSAVGAPPVISDIAGLQTALDSKIDDSQVSAFGATLVDDVSAATARSTLGLGTLATQAASAVALAGGTINGVTIGATTRASVSATTLNATTAIAIGTTTPTNLLDVRGAAASNGLAIPAVTTANIVSSEAAAFGIGPILGFSGKYFGADAVTFAAIQGALQGTGSGDSAAGFLSFKLTNAVTNGLDERLRLEWNGILRPGTDNSQSFGTAAFRWSTVYAATGTINTSDEREKTWRGALNEAEMAAANEIAACIGLFQWNDAVEEKGAGANDGGARMHCGVKAQQVWGIMAKHGLVDPIGKNGKPGKTPYAFLCWDEWRDEKDKRRKLSRYGVRTDQLALFLIATMAAAIGTTP